MAGMFSMLNTNHLRVDSSQPGPAISSRDDGSGGRTTPRRTPIASRRMLREAGANSNVMKLNMGRDRLPRSMRRKRIYELHPMLRRSVCTLILAALAIMTGIIIIIVDATCANCVLPSSGFVVLGIGVMLVLVGLIWFKFSKRKLEFTKKKAEQLKINKVKIKSSKELKNSASVDMVTMTSKHAIKWPSKKSCSADNMKECKVKVTTPNGNHYAGDYPFPSSESDDDAAPDRKLVPTSLPLGLVDDNGNSPDARLMDGRLARESNPLYPNYHLYADKECPRLHESLRSYHRDKEVYESTR